MTVSKEFQRGLDAAADFLLSTAGDFDQMIAQIKMGPQFPVTKQEVTAFTRQAILLRGQARQVRELKSDSER